MINLLNQASPVSCTAKFWALCLNPLSPNYNEFYEKRWFASLPPLLYPFKLFKKLLLEKGRIKVENTNGAILMISGADDQMWPSKLLSEQAVERLKSRNFKYPYKHLSYPNCGHVIWVPYGPLPPTRTVHPVDHNSYIDSRH